MIKPNKTSFNFSVKSYASTVDDMKSNGLQTIRINVPLSLSKYFKKAKK